MPRARLTTLAAVAAVLACASVAAAQETPSQARARSATEALNQAPDGSTLGSESSRPAPVAPRAASRTASGRTLTDLLNQTADDVPARQDPVPAARPPVSRRAVQTPPAETPKATAPTATAQAPDASENPDAVLADVPAGPPSALPPLPLGYYVRGLKACNEVWPGDGDLAWLSEIAFTLDFGGCDPNQIVQLSDTTWHEDQRCQTELGGNGGLYSIDYEVTSPTTLTTRTRLTVDDTGQDQLWTYCSTDDVPEEARFHRDVSA